MLPYSSINRRIPQGYATAVCAADGTLHCRLLTVVEVVGRTSLLQEKPFEQSSRSIVYLIISFGKLILG